MDGDIPVSSYMGHESQIKLWALVNVMADRSQLSTDRESKLYTASNTRPRLGSDSSYVALRETAKLKQGIRSSNSNARQKKDRRKPAKRPEKLNKENTSAKPSSSHFHNKHTCTNGLCIHRLIQFLVVIFSVCALAIVILMILGVLGPDRCPCKRTGEIMFGKFCCSLVQSSVWYVSAGTPASFWFVGCCWVKTHTVVTRAAKTL